MIEFLGIDFLEILNTYGLPTALAFIFIWFYKQSSDKYNNFLRDAIKTESQRADKTEEIAKELKELRSKTEDLTLKTNELQRTIMSYLLKDKD